MFGRKEKDLETPVKFILFVKKLRQSRKHAISLTRHCTAVLSIEPQANYSNISKNSTRASSVQLFCSAIVHI